MFSSTPTFILFLYTSLFSSLLWRRDVGREEESGSEVWMKSVDGVEEKKCG